MYQPIKTAEDEGRLYPVNQKEAAKRLQTVTPFTLCEENVSL